MDALIHRYLLKLCGLFEQEVDLNGLKQAMNEISANHIIDEAF